MFKGNDKAYHRKKTFDLKKMNMYIYCAKFNQINCYKVSINLLASLKTEQKTIFARNACFLIIKNV